MARTVNRAAHAVRRDAFLDVAQRLILARGYERMSVQDVLDELDASRGAFYHYFDSKVALLEGVVDRIGAAATEAVLPVLDDPALTAPEKLARLFSGIARWKSQRKELMLQYLRVWYSDDNALLRDKVRESTMTGLAPMLARIIEQGRAEGVFTVDSAEESARIFVYLLMGAQDVAGRLFFACEAGLVSFEEVEHRFAAFGQAYERLLGAPAGSLRLTDMDVVREWFGPGNVPPEEQC